MRWTQPNQKVAVTYDTDLRNKIVNAPAVYAHPAAVQNAPQSSTGRQPVLPVKIKRR